MQATTRRVWIAGCVLVCVTLAGVLVARAPGSAQPAAPQPPVFRRDATFVQVDVYPLRDGRPIEDLAQEDFEILEDGAPQTIREFQRISRPAITTVTERKDPNSVAEAFEQAADGSRRVFVVFLDTTMTTVEGAHSARKPLVSMLEQLVGPDDLYAVMTPDMRAGSLTFARRTEGLDADLASYWTWGRRDARGRRDAEDQQIDDCFPDPAPERYCTGPGGTPVRQPERAYRGVAEQLIERRGETRALKALEDLVQTLGLVREGRKAVIVVSQGWRLLGPKPELTRLQECDSAPRIPTPGIGTSGRLVPDTAVDRPDPTQRTEVGCHQLALTYASVDNEPRFRDLIARANRFNVSFYPFDTRGLAVFDRSIEVRDEPIRNDPGERSPRLQGQLQGPSAETMRLATRVATLRTLAEETGGIAVVNTHNLNAGAARIVGDLSSYYLLGYQSTNSRLDGRWRSITVRVKRPGVNVRARKGYRALTQEEAAAMSAAGAAGPATSPDFAKATSGLAEAEGGGGSAGSATGASLPSVADAVRSLAALDRPVPWRSRAAWRLEAANGEPKSRARFWITSEFDAARGKPEWASGGDLTATLTLADGAAIGSTTARLEPGATTLETAIDANVAAGADIVVKLRLAPAGGGLPLTDVLRITAGVQAGERLYRSAPSTGNRFVAAAAPRFRRGERLRVTTPIDVATAVAEASLLDRAGAAMRVPAAARIETIDGHLWAIGEVSLVPLSVGDYALQIVVRANDQTRHVLTAFRVTP
jgi:VWFA-related protein